MIRIAKPYVFRPTRFSYYTFLLEFCIHKKRVQHEFVHNQVTDNTILYPMVVPKISVCVIFRAKLKQTHIFGAIPTQGSTRKL